MRVIDKLLSNLYRSFGRDPGARIALRVRHSGGLVWQVRSRELRCSTAAGASIITLPLHSITFAALATALQGAGCTVVYVDADLAGLAADTLIDGDGREDVSNGDALYAYTSPLWALLDSYSLALEAANDSVESALIQARFHTSEAEWLDYWGSHFGVFRGAQVLLGGDLGGTESDHAYLIRVVAEVLRPRVNKYAIEQTILELSGEVVELFEPWRHVFMLDKSALSGEDHLHDGHYWTWNVIRPIISGPISSKNWERVLRIIERNRPIGVLVADPEWYPDVIGAVAPSATVKFLVEFMLELHIEASREVPLGDMILDDNWFIFNHPALIDSEFGVYPMPSYYDGDDVWTGDWDDREWGGGLNEAHVLDNSVSFAHETEAI